MLPLVLLNHDCMGLPIGKVEVVNDKLILKFLPGYKMPKKYRVKPNLVVNETEGQTSMEVVNFNLVEMD